MDARPRNQVFGLGRSLGVLHARKCAFSLAAGHRFSPNQLGGMSVELTKPGQQITFMMMCINNSIAPSKGLGQPILSLTPQQVSDVIVVQWIFGASYGMSTASIKISLLLQYLRVFKRSSFSWLFSAFWLVLIFLWGLGMSWISWLPCLPHPDSWWKGTKIGCYGIASDDPQLPPRIIMSHSAVNVFFDTIVFGLAFRLQFGKDLPTNVRGVRAILLFGVLSWVFAIWRMADIIVSQGAGVQFDPSYNTPQPYLLSIAEIYLASTYATVPFFWPLLTQAFSKIFVTYELKIESEERYPQPNSGYPISAGAYEQSPYENSAYPPTADQPAQTGYTEEQLQQMAYQQQMAYAQQQHAQQQYPQQYLDQQGYPQQPGYPQEAYPQSATTLSSGYPQSAGGPNSAYSTAGYPTTASGYPTTASGYPTSGYPASGYTKGYTPEDVEMQYQGMTTPPPATYSPFTAEKLGASDSSTWDMSSPSQGSSGNSQQQQRWQRNPDEPFIDYSLLVDDPENLGTTVAVSGVQKATQPGQNNKSKSKPKPKKDRSSKKSTPKRRDSVSSMSS
jgi:hypothetical protein